MNKNIEVNVSIIVPAYNIEKFLGECLDSLLNQNRVATEIIIIDDGSTDSTGAIADKYVHHHNQIKVIHQENKGVSTARNIGIKTAQGKYILFVDGDDRIKENSLSELYQLGEIQNADIVIGNVLYFYQDNCVRRSPLQLVPEDLKYTIICGKDAFTGLIKFQAYHPGAHCYMFKKNYIDQLQLHFDESIRYDEDELFTSLALCQAGRVLITDLEFYFYRQRQGSAVYSMSNQRKVISLLYVADRLINYADKFHFSGNDRVLKSWLYVKIFNIYFHAFNFLQQINDTSFDLPEFHLELFWKSFKFLSPDAQKKCKEYYLKALWGINKYIDWRLSDWATINLQYTGNEKLLLIYNKLIDEELSGIKKDIPLEWIITTDRKYLSKADAVVFYLPHLQMETGDDIEKRNGQIWIAWYPEPEEDYPWMTDNELRELFDIRMIYKKQISNLCPYYRYQISKILSQKLCLERKQNGTKQEEKTHPFIPLLRIINEIMLSNQ